MIYIIGVLLSALCTLEDPCYYPEGHIYFNVNQTFIGQALSPSYTHLYQPVFFDTHYSVYLYPFAPVEVLTAGNLLTVFREESCWKTRPVTLGETAQAFLYQDQVLNITAKIARFEPVSDQGNYIYPYSDLLKKSVPSTYLSGPAYGPYLETYHSDYPFQYVGVYWDSDNATTNC